LRSFIEPDLFDNNVPFDNTTPIYLINLLWKLGLDLRVALFYHLSWRITKTSTLSSTNFTGKVTPAKTMHSNDEQQNQITYSRTAYE